MDNKFQVGDVVRLKSGGPNMTITSFYTKEPCTHFPSAPEGWAKCMWYTGHVAEGTYKTEFFNPDSLTLGQTQGYSS